MNMTRINFSIEEIEEKLRDVKFHTPPKCSGQTVLASYGCDDNGFVYRKIIDQSDNAMTIDRSRMLMDDDGDYYNSEPRNKRWREIYRGKCEEKENE